MHKITTTERIKSKRFKYPYTLDTAMIVGGRRNNEEQEGLQALRQCPDCSSEEIGFSYDAEEHFCKKCGLVLE